MAAAKVASHKALALDNLVQRILSSNVVGIASVHGIPAFQLQRMRKQLRGTASLTVAKNRLLLLALERASKEKRGVEKLADVVGGQAALVTSNLTPFKLFKKLEATKTKAPAKGGEIAPEDIVVNEGETPFKPGPVVGDLQKAGIPAAIDKGKVVIKKEKLLVKKGDRIPKEIAPVLARLEIFPLTVGLDLLGAYEDGALFKPDVLAVDESKVLEELKLAASQAVNMAMFLHYPSKATIRPLLADAYTKAIIIAVRVSYPTRETLPHLTRQAQAKMLSLASKIPGALDDDLRKALAVEGTEERKEEKSKEEKVDEEAASGLSTLFG